MGRSFASPFCFCMFCLFIWVMCIIKRNHWDDSCYGQCTVTLQRTTFLLQQWFCWSFPGYIVCWVLHGRKQKKDKTNMIRDRTVTDQAGG